MDTVSRMKSIFQASQEGNANAFKKLLESYEANINSRDIGNQQSFIGFKFNFFMGFKLNSFMGFQF